VDGFRLSCPGAGAVPEQLAELLFKIGKEDISGGGGCHALMY
jgi:hypothetical protein